MYPEGDIARQGGGATSTEQRSTQQPGQAGAGPPAQAPQPAPKRDARETARLIGFVVIVALLIAFVVDNSETVAVGFIFFTAHVSLIWVLIVTALLGALADRLVQRRSRKRAAAGGSRRGGRGGK